MNNTSSNINNNNIIVTKKRKNKNIKDIKNAEELNNEVFLLNGRIIGLVGLLSILLFRIKKLY